MDILNFVINEGGNKIVARIESILGKKPSSGDDLVVAACKLRDCGDEYSNSVFELSSKLDKNVFYDEFYFYISQYELYATSEDIASRIRRLNSLLEYSYDMFYCIELACLQLSSGDVTKARRLLSDTRNMLGSSTTIDDLMNDVKNGTERYRQYLQEIESQRSQSKDISNKSDSSFDNTTVIKTQAKSNTNDNNENGYCDLIENAFSEMIGMDIVKTQLEKIYKRIILDKARSEYSSNNKDIKGYNFILCGNPGTGKTTVARIIAKILYECGILEKEEIVETDRSVLVGQYIGDTEKNTRDAIERSRGGALFIDEAYTLYEEDSPRDFGHKVISTLLKDMEDNRGKYSVILAGYKDKMDNMIKKANIGFSSRFDYHIDIPDYSDEDLYRIIISMAKARNMKIADDAKTVIFDCIKRERIDETFDNARYMRRLLDSAMENQADRLYLNGRINKNDLYLLTKEDFGFNKTNDTVLSLEDYLDQLDHMIGLDSVKRDIREIVESINVQEERKKRGLITPNKTNTCHLAFVGNPGTGKTTVARLYGKILAKLGVLKREDVFVECSRADLVAGYLGQTAIKTKDLIHSALGGVLFIDEAYNLINGPNDSFGMEAINTLIAEMENKRDRLVVIFAGYTNEIYSFMDTNPGIKSRISKIIDFPDYTIDELVEVFFCMMKGRGYDLSSINSDMVKNLIEDKSKQKDFGNARGVRNICDRVERHMSSRLNASIKNNRVSDNELLKVLPSDLKE